MREIEVFYDERLKRYGEDVRAVGWPSIEQQQLRFSILVDGLDLKESRTLDVGCGFGDLAGFIWKSWPNCREYTGIDVSSAMIETARRKSCHNNNTFQHISFEELEAYQEFDFIFMSGAMNLKTKESESKRLDTFFTKAKEVLNNKGTISANFLSAEVDYKQDLHRHYDMKKVVATAEKLWNKVRIIRGYGLYEFTVQAKD